MRLIKPQTTKCETSAGDMNWKILLDLFMSVKNPSNAVLVEPNLVKYVEGQKPFKCDTCDTRLGRRHEKERPYNDSVRACTFTICLLSVTYNKSK